MPKFKKSDLLMTSFMAFLVVAVFGAVCLRVASAGGPDWLEGREFEVFLKLAGVTLVAAIAEISWRALSTKSTHQPTDRTLRP